MAFWASEAQYTRIREAARQAHTSMSEWLRRLADRECSNNSDTPRADE
jgi:hypothetical protein